MGLHQHDIGHDCSDLRRLIEVNIVPGIGNVNNIGVGTDGQHGFDFAGRRRHRSGRDAK